jgi:hypothetical protein
MLIIIIIVSSLSSASLRVCESITIYVYLESTPLPNAYPADGGAWEAELWCIRDLGGET